MNAFKKPVAAVLATLCILGATAPSFASSPASYENVGATTEKIDSANQTTQYAPYKDEVEWVVRYLDGKYQMRLFSHTRGIWLTEWIDMDPPKV